MQARKDRPDWENKGTRLDTPKGIPAYGEEKGMLREASRRRQFQTAIHLGIMPPPPPPRGGELW